MSYATRIGAVTLLAALLLLRFGGGLAAAVGLVIGLAALAAGLTLDRLARRRAATRPVQNWAEEFTARVRRDRAALTATREAARLGDATGRETAPGVPAAPAG